MRCDYSDGRSMGSTRVGFCDDAVIPVVRCEFSDWCWPTWTLCYVRTDTLAWILGARIGRTDLRHGYSWLDPYGVEDGAEFVEVLVWRAG